MSAEICYTPATELAALMRDGEVSPVDVMLAFIERTEAVDPQLHAYVTLCPEAALAAARAAETALLRNAAMGPLTGVPFSAKDLLFSAGVRTTGGSVIYADHVPRIDAIVIERLRNAGAILLGKTSTPEFGFKSTTENQLVGTTLNPWSPAHTAGGSSGGAAAAVAAGLGPLAIGTDAGGSIRTPASFCGIVGFKPTFGRVPSGPGFGGGASISHTGPMTRTVADCELMFRVMAGADERDRRSVGASLMHEPPPAGPIRRVACSVDLGYAAVHPEVRQCFEQATATLAALGWELDPDVPAIEDPEDDFNVIIRAENHVFAQPLVAGNDARLDPDYRAFTRRGAALTAAQYLAANAARDRLADRFAAIFATADLLVTPTLAVPPFPHGERPQAVDGVAIDGMDWLSFTYPFNLTGHPAASVPCGRTREGLPIGLQIVGPRFADLKVLAACAEFEAAAPWHERRPPLDD